MTSPAPIQSADLSGIIERLEKATGPDRKLDGFISRAIGDKVDFGEFSGPWSDYPKPDGYRPTHPYTASVDAAIALAERVLPGFAMIMGMNQGPSTKPWARAGKWVGSDATGPNLAIAICLATLRVLQSKGDAQ